MRNILLLHGINLNFLGKRNPKYYGTFTLYDLEKIIAIEAQKFNYQVVAYQSNYEGALIDIIQSESKNSAGIIINPGAFAHYSYGLHDALYDTGLPVVEVHLSDIDQREPWRQKSVIAPICINVIKGKKERGYKEAVHILLEYLQYENK